MKQISKTITRLIHGDITPSFNRQVSLSRHFVICLLGGLALLVTSCQKSDHLVPPANKTVDDAKATASLAMNSLTSLGKPMQVVIDENYPILSPVNPNPGTFSLTVSGGPTITGVCDFYFNPVSPVDSVTGNFIEAHNQIIFTADDGSGTFTIKDECNFSVNQANPFGRGQWQISGGTGAYSSLKGNGEESFPSFTEDILTGIIHN